MLKHKDCGGLFESFHIPEHGYCFLQCAKCGHYFGGDRTAKEVHRLMKIKVRPTIRRGV